jgi:hypothetical protein
MAVGNEMRIRARLPTSDRRTTSRTGGLALLLSVIVTGAFPAMGSDSAGDAFANRVVRRAGASKITCIARIQQLEQRMREERPEYEFHALCAELPRQTADLERVQRAVESVVEDLRSDGAAVDLESDWVEHRYMGRSISATYKLGDQSVIVWWHPSMRMLELRIWKPKRAAASRPAEEQNP